MSKYKWVRHGNQKLFAVGILEDGTLHNPNGYPEDVVREAVLAADARRTERRRNGAKKAAVTRASARRRLIFKAATMVAQGQGIRNLSHCYVCGRHLDDPASVERGIGPECWEGVLALVARLIPLTPKADADLRDVQARLFSARPSQPDEQATEPAP